MPSCPLAKISSCTQARKKKCKQKADALLTSFSSASGSDFETSASEIGRSTSNSSSISSISSISSGSRRKNSNSINSDSSNNSWPKIPSDFFLQQTKERLEFPFEFRWARDDQLSTILEESRKNSLISSYKTKTPTPSLLPLPVQLPTPPSPPKLPPPPPSPPTPPPPPPQQRQRQTKRHQQPQQYQQYQQPLPLRQPQPKKTNPKVLRKPAPKKFIPREKEVPILKQFIMSERRSSSISPKPIRPPPRDVSHTKLSLPFKLISFITPENINSDTYKLDAISRMDASLVFEHFTTSDAWDLGSTLRERLLPIPTPVVINISLANQNQTIFHSVTHSGVMPDNESWVERKRRTVLRWGCSTWFMACKFGGDEKAFRERYALGNNAGDYAIHGGGVPIRVTGVEGVVAVVVVSGLKEDEDHAVIVEVIKDLYY